MKDDYNVSELDAIIAYIQSQRGDIEHLATVTDNALEIAEQCRAIIAQERTDPDLVDYVEKNMAVLRQLKPKPQEPALPASEVKALRSVEQTLDRALAGNIKPAEHTVEKRYTRQEIGEMSKQALAIAQTTEDRFPASMVAESLDDYLVTEGVPAEKRQMAIQQVMQGRLEMTVETWGLYSKLKNQFLEAKEDLSKESLRFKYAVGAGFSGGLTGIAALSFDHPMIALAGLLTSLASFIVGTYDQATKKQTSSEQLAPQPAALPPYDKPIVGDIVLVHDDYGWTTGVVTKVDRAKAYLSFGCEAGMPKYQAYLHEIKKIQYLKRSKKIESAGELATLTESTPICIDGYYMTDRPKIAHIGRIIKTQDGRYRQGSVGETAKDLLENTLMIIRYYNSGNSSKIVKKGCEVYVLEVTDR